MPFSQKQIAFINSLCCIDILRWLCVTVNEYWKNSKPRKSKILPLGWNLSNISSDTLKVFLFAKCFYYYYCLFKHLFLRKLLGIYRNHTRDDNSSQTKWKANKKSNYNRFLPITLTMNVLSEEKGNQENCSEYVETRHGIGWKIDWRVKTKISLLFLSVIVLFNPSSLNITPGN